MALLTYSTPSGYKSAPASMLLVLSVFLMCHDKLASAAEEVVAHRGETLTITSGNVVHVSGDGGFIRLMGGGAVLINVSPQSLYQSATGEATTNGNVENGLSQHGSGAMTIHGTVRGGLELAGSGAITVNGDVHGTIKKTGSGALVVTGHRYP